MSEPQPTPQRQWTAGAVVLLVIGLVILVPSGLCTGYLGIMGLFYGGSASETSDVLTMALLYGGPFIALGAILVYAGFRIRKQN